MVGRPPPPAEVFATGVRRGLGSLACSRGPHRSPTRSTPGSTSSGPARACAWCAGTPPRRSELTGLDGPVLGSVPQPANYEAQRGHRPGRGGAITPVGRGSSNGSAGRRSWKCRVGGWCQQLCIARGQCRSCRPATGPVRAAGVPPPCEPGTSARARSPNPAATLRAGARTQAEGPEPRFAVRGQPR